MAPLKKYKNQNRTMVSRYDILSGTINKAIKRQRGRPKLIQKDLRAIGIGLQSEDSLKVQTENTFDKLMTSYQRQRETHGEPVMTRSMSRSLPSSSSKSDDRKVANKQVTTSSTTKSLLNLSSELESAVHSAKDATVETTSSMAQSKNPNETSVPGDYRVMTRSATRSFLSLSLEPETPGETSDITTEMPSLIARGYRNRFKSKVKKCVIPSSTPIVAEKQIDISTSVSPISAAKFVRKSNFIDKNRNVYITLRNRNIPCCVSDEKLAVNHGIRRDPATGQPKKRSIIYMTDSSCRTEERSESENDQSGQVGNIFTESIRNLRKFESEMLHNSGEKGHNRWLDIKRPDSNATPTGVRRRSHPSYSSTPLPKRSNLMRLGLDELDNISQVIEKTQDLEGGNVNRKSSNKPYNRNAVAIGTRSKSDGPNVLIQLRQETVVNLMQSDFNRDEEPQRKFNQNTVPLDTRKKSHDADALPQLKKEAIVNVTQMDFIDSDEESEFCVTDKSSHYVECIESLEDTKELHAADSLPQLKKEVVINVTHMDFIRDEESDFPMTDSNSQYTERTENFEDTSINQNATSFGAGKESHTADVLSHLNKNEGSDFCITDNSRQYTERTENSEDTNVNQSAFSFGARKRLYDSDALTQLCHVAVVNVTQMNLNNNEESVFSNNSLASLEDANINQSAVSFGTRKRSHSSEPSSQLNKEAIVNVTQMHFNRDYKSDFRITRSNSHHTKRTESLEGTSITQSPISLSAGREWGRKAMVNIMQMDFNRDEELGQKAVTQMDFNRDEEAVFCITDSSSYTEQIEKNFEEGDVNKDAFSFEARKRSQESDAITQLCPKMEFNGDEGSVFYITDDSSCCTERKESFEGSKQARKKSQLNNAALKQKDLNRREESVFCITDDDDSHYTEQTKWLGDEQHGTSDSNALTQLRREAVVNVTQIDFNKFLNAQNTENESGDCSDCRIVDDDDERLERLDTVGEINPIWQSKVLNYGRKIKEENKENRLAPIAETSRRITLPSFASLRKSLATPGRSTFYSQDKPLLLKPGKEWRRSLLASRRPVNVDCQDFDDDSGRGECVASDGIVCACIQCKKNTIGDSILPERLSVRVVPLPSIANANAKRLSYLENYAVSIYPSYVSNGGDETLFDGYIEHLSLEDDGFARPEEADDDDDDNRKDSRLEETTGVVGSGVRSVTARDVVLNKCKQSEPLPFEKCYPNSILQHCQKIGEGVFGEVFLFRNPNGGVTVIKIIPIEGSLTVNGERQKKFEEILSEITIQMELTNLRENAENRTSSFSQLQKVMCVRGRYPQRLLELWELFEETQGTQNDSPECFDDDQLYVVLELANGGKDMECYVFNNSLQAHALFKQIACTLAVAEASLEFEHRDLHIGNVLVSAVSPRQVIAYRLNGKDIEVATHGTQLTIIDYTLSRIKHNGVFIYNDLSMDPDLFTADGDYQFEIYRLMKKSNKNNWQRFEPYSNVLWMHYILDKMLRGLRYKNKRSRTHIANMRELERLYEKILSYKSAEDFVANVLMED